MDGMPPLNKLELTKLDSDCQEEFPLCPPATKELRCCDVLWQASPVSRPADLVPVSGGLALT